MISLRTVGSAVVLLLLFSGAAKSTIPQELAWQGVVLDENSTPLSDGVYTFHFSIFADDVGGSPLWQEAQAVNVQRTYQALYQSGASAAGGSPASLFNLSPTNWSGDGKSNTQ